MSTTTIIQLVRWRVRHLAACLYACRLPLVGNKQIELNNPNFTCLNNKNNPYRNSNRKFYPILDTFSTCSTFIVYACEDEPDCSTSTDEVPKKKMVFDPIGESRRRETSRQKLRRKNRDQERASSPENPKQKSSSKRSEDRRGESSMSSFAEEEYIVFCFTDDGEIQMVKEKRSSEASHGPINPAKRRSRRVNHTTKKTQNCGENAEETYIPSHVVGDPALYDEHAEEEGSNDVEVECHPDEIKEINHNGPQENRTLSSMLSVAESSDSNQSDASTGSFAFPILGREWMGSPVHMPKPEDLHLRKHKARVVRLYCCRF